MYPKVDWILFLPSLQTQLNNSLNAITELSLNEVIYEFKVRKLMFVIDSQKLSKVIHERRLEYQREVIDATTFANAKVKMYYDAKHQLILFNFDDRVYLRLHQDYNLSDRSNRKMFNQRCELFIVKRRVDKLAYELNLSSH